MTVAEELRREAEYIAPTLPMSASALLALAARVEAIAYEMRAEKMNESGTPMWIRGQVVEWAAELATEKE